MNNGEQRRRLRRRCSSLFKLRKWGNQMYLGDGHWWNDTPNKKVNTERWFFALTWGYVQMYHFRPGDEAEWSDVEFWIHNDFQESVVKRQLENSWKEWMYAKDGHYKHPIDMLVWHLNRQRADMDYDDLTDVDLNDSQDFEILVQDFGFHVLMNIWTQRASVFGVRSLDWIYGLIELAYLQGLGQNLCTKGLEFATNIALMFEDCEPYPREAFGRWMHTEVEKGDTLWIWRDGMPVEIGYFCHWKEAAYSNQGVVCLIERASKDRSFDAIGYNINLVRGSFSQYQGPHDVWTWNGIRWSRPSVIGGKEVWSHERQGRLGNRSGSEGRDNSGGGVSTPLSDELYGSGSSDSTVSDDKEHEG